MKSSNRLLFILFSFVLSFSIFGNLSKTYAESYTETIPVYGTIDEAIIENSEHFIIKENNSMTEKPLLKSGSVGWEEWTLSSTKVLNSNYRYGWHPDFTNSYYNVDGYYFSSTKKSTLTVSISGGYRAFSVSVGSSAPSSGYIISATSTKKSRPAVYGELLEQTYGVKVFNGAGIQTSSRTEKKNGCRNTQAKVDYIQ